MNATPSSPVTPPSSDRPRLALLLRRAWYGLNQTFRRRIAGAGVTPDQFTILRWLGEHPEGLTQRVLADLMASDPNTITAILTRMQKAGLVERRAHADDARCTPRSNRSPVACRNNCSPPCRWRNRRSFSSSWNRSARRLMRMTPHNQHAKDVARRDAFPWDRRL
jgi:MarR family